MYNYLDVRHGDFDNPESLVAAFADVERLLIVSTSSMDNDTLIRQHLAAVHAAQRAGVEFIAYTSIVDAEKTSVGFGVAHFATEEAIRKTGIPFSFLRNNWYIENEIDFILGAAAGAPIVISAEDGKVGWATRDDYAYAAAAVLRGSGHENTVYELSGTPKTYEEFASEFAKVLQRDVSVQKVDDETYANIISSAGLPDFIVSIMVGIQGAIRQGSLDVKSNDLQTLLGRPARPLSEAITRLLKEQRPTV